MHTGVFLDYFVKISIAFVVCLNGQVDNGFSPCKDIIVVRFLWVDAMSTGSDYSPAIWHWHVVMQN